MNRQQKIRNQNIYQIKANTGQHMHYTLKQQGHVKVGTIKNCDKKQKLLKALRSY